MVGVTANLPTLISKIISKPVLAIKLLKKRQFIFKKNTRRGNHFIFLCYNLKQFWEKRINFLL
jgi:hypothetical protein